ncbi:MAG: xanthine dehydrogenase small subunit [Gammaproteobacteria bacterium]|nr:xanthine dehydrogenase small subunit [Gammaproteobacteria bacterium]
MIQFLLNNELVELETVNADTTVLGYLRDAKHQCGTKEGCASGDCGACTVVVAEPNGETLEYKNINSCITFLGALHGKQLITVEHLAEPGQLHSVQKAMVDHHGSQCGFCTPGFVLSLFALQKSFGGNSDNVHHHAPRSANIHESSDKRANIDEYLGGNLCRCTGYRPIIDAGLQSLENHQTDQFDKCREQTLHTLNTINHAHQNAAKENANIIGENSGKDRNSRFHVPTNLEQLHELMAHYPTARLLGGGTDLSLEVTQQLKSLERIILLTRVSELTQVVEHDDHFAIGAAVSLSKTREVLAPHYPDINELLLRFGSRQIRNQGTIGGNVANASPIGDFPPVLIAIDAQLELERKASTQIKSRVIDVEDYFLDYKKTDLREGEIIRSIIIPKPSPPSKTQSNLKVYKISKRIDDDISAVCAAISIEVADNTIATARVALGGMAAIPKRATLCEKALCGAPLNKETITKAQTALKDDFQPIGDARASAKYRIRVAQNLLSKLQIELTNTSIPTRVTYHD